jgi:2-dehydro-3-deoxyphosphogalactonate aldolase
MNSNLLPDFKRDLAKAPVIAILRGVTPATVLPVCEALVAGGVRFIEVTLNSPDPFSSIRKAVDQLAAHGVHIGAGTVLLPDEVDRVVDAGGTYIISPNMDPAVIRRTRERGLISIPGFLTPSEAFAALAAGADLLKCFPAGSLGAGYIKDLKAVLPASIIAVGGVDSGNIREYLQNGAAGVGVGSSLYKPNRSAQEIRQAAASLMARMS